MAASDYQPADNDVPTLNVERGGQADGHYEELGSHDGYFDVVGDAVDDRTVATNPGYEGVEATRAMAVNSGYMDTNLDTNPDTDPDTHLQIDEEC